MSTAPLYGLILSGGKSTRMGQDKGSLALGGLTQVERTRSLLAPHCENVVLSNRADQGDLDGYAGFEQVHDVFGDVGPLGGILSAMTAYPDAAWLVVACDMPYASEAAIRELIEARGVDEVATLFLDTDGRPQPLFAIYEPSCVESLKDALSRGCYSLRDAIKSAPVKWLQLTDERTLLNMNTPEEYEDVRKQWDG